MLLKILDVAVYNNQIDSFLSRGTIIKSKQMENSFKKLWYQSKVGSKIDHLV